MAIETIIPALIGALATLGAAVYAKRQRHRARRFEDVFDRYGVYVRALFERVEVLDASGGNRITRTLEGIRASSGEVTARIPGRFWVSTPNGRVGTPRILVAKGFPRPVDLDVVVSREKGVEFDVVIEGGLHPRDPPLAFTVDITIEEGFVFDRDRFDAAYPHDRLRMEYHAVEIQCPVRDLTIELVLPDGIAIDPIPLVLVGFSETVDSAETHRARAGFSQLARTSRLKVEEPLIGRRYAIAWRPE